jgi:hypothetical protein
VTTRTEDYAARLAEVEKDIDRLVRRLQSLSTLAWSTRREVVRSLLGQLIEISGRAEGRCLPELPDVADFALADAVAVIASDSAGAVRLRRDDVLLDEFAQAVRAALLGTR